MLDEQGHLECEMEELRLEIKENAERIDKLCNLLKQNNTKLRKIKEMNYAEKRKEKIINDNWKVETMNANYPMLEVIDENTVKIDGVEYKKVEKEKPITLQRIIADCVISHNSGMDLSVLENILDRVEVEFLSQKVVMDEEEPIVDVVEYHRGWDNCLKELKGRLRE